MQQIRNVFLTTDAFGIELDKNAVVQLSFGPAKVSMTKEAALDFQYRLSAFIAYLDLEERGDSDQDVNVGIEDSKNILKFLASYRKSAEV